MSYDIYLRGPRCPTCSHVLEGDGGDDLPNPTYNLTPIFDLALTGENLPNPDVSEAAVVLFAAGTDRPRGLRLLDGLKAGDTVSWLRKAVRQMTAAENRERFLALEPPNKWGDFKGAIEVVERLLTEAERWPTKTWEVR